MIGGAIAYVYARTKPVRWIWIMVLLVVVAGSIWSASRARFATDLFEALPPDPGIRRYQALVATAVGERPVVVGFHGNATIEELAAAADRFALDLADDPAIRTALTEPDPAFYEETKQALLERLPLYADPMLLEHVARMDDVALDSAFMDLRNSLAGLGAEMDVASLQYDPFGMVDPLMDRMLASADRAGMVLIDGRLFTPDSSMALVLVIPSSEASDEVFHQVMEDRLQKIRSTGISAAPFGAAPMAIVNQERIKTDALWTSSVATILIIGLLIWRYRSVRIPLLFLVPPILGFVIGVGIMAMIRPVISALALGGSAALIGIALDYCFHFFTHLRHRGEVSVTLKEVASPMLLGNITTILAFGALSFASSQVIADLGIIAAFTLLAAVFIVLFVLPHFVGRISVPAEVPGDADQLEQPRKWLWKLGVVVAITLFLLPFVDAVSYSEDPEQLAYVPPELKMVRDAIEGEEGRPVNVFLAAHGATEEEARQRLERSVDQLRGQDPALSQMVFPTDLRPSTVELAERLDLWRELFGGGSGEAFITRIEEAARRNGFRGDAFTPFTLQIRSPDTAPPPPQLERWVQGLVVELEGEVIVAGAMALPPAALEDLEREMAGVDTANLLHRGILGARIGEIVQEDLQGILWRTSLIVFVVLLTTYGRIELAMLTFLPMALGWVWIMGICGLTGIQFDLVNIIVCTFIFGLGDDYCIFTTEGMLARYRTGADHARSFRHAVVLSAITTIIGTGVLLFAVHPALRSIATLAVTGMVVLIAIALVVQPALFHSLITSRAEAGKRPITLRVLLISSIAYGTFALGCILLVILQGLLWILPLPRSFAHKIIRHGIRWFCWILIHIMFNLKKDIQGFAEQVRTRPAIIVANHSSFIDILLMLMVTDRAVMMVNHWVWNSPLFGAVVRSAGYLYTGDGLDVNEQKVKKAVAEGLSVIVFPEGTRSAEGSMGRFHKGAFHLAWATDVPVLPVVLHGAHQAIPKKDMIVYDAVLTMRTLTPVHMDDQGNGTSILEKTRWFSRLMKQEYARIRNERETPSWYHQRLVHTFTYKGPMLEWHTRIKARMDEPVHAYLHAHIAHDADVVDLGSGHGMVAFLLHWMAPGRWITGVEHDAEKVAMAKHISRNDRGLEFIQSDLAHYTPPDADAYILKDVLHYLPEEVQQRTLRACSEGLKPGGAIFVRDGFSGMDDGHQRTVRGERFSTGFGFNKAKDGLHFISGRRFEEMAGQAGLSVEWVMKDDRNSNKLAVLTKEQA